MNDEVASKVIEAYRASPLLTGLLLLNFVSLIGFGWHLGNVQRGAGEFVARMQADLMTVVKECAR